MLSWSLLDMIELGQSLFDAGAGRERQADVAVDRKVDPAGQRAPLAEVAPGGQAWLVAAHGQVLGDLHDWFYGHGFNNPPNWYAGDCTHPNTFGHDQIRRRFYTLITGETLP